MSATIQVIKYDLLSHRQSSMHYGAESFIQPLESSCQQIVAIDPSKTSLGLVIGDTGHQLTGIYSVHGARMDNHVYCSLLKQFLFNLCHKLPMAHVVQEEVILPKQGHFSMVTQNEIRCAINDVFIDEMGQTPEELCNWTWKNSMLPKEFRKKGLSAKGSKLLVSQIIPELYYLPDDITDALLMYFYAKRVYNARNKNVYCTQEETGDVTVSFHEQEPLGATPFRYNQRFSLMSNAVFYANRRADAGMCQVPVDCVDIPLLYRSECHVTANVGASVYMLVRRNTNVESA